MIKRQRVGIPLPDEPQPLQRQQLVHLVDLLAEGNYRRGQAAGRQRRGFAPEGLAQAGDDPVDLTREAVDDARLERRLSRSPDDLLRLLEVDREEPGGPLGQRLDRDLNARRDAPAEVLAVRRHHVVVDRRAEVGNDAGPAAALVRSDRVYHAVGPDLVRVLDPKRHPDPERRPDDRQRAAEVALRHPLVLATEVRHDRRRDRPVHVAQPQVTQREQARKHRCELVRGGLPLGRETPVLDELLAAEHAHVGLRVADVDREQHGGDYPAPERHPGGDAKRQRPHPRHPHDPLRVAAIRVLDRGS